MAHAVASAIVLIHPVFEAGKTSLDLRLVLVGKSVLVLKVESYKAAGGEIRTVLTDGDTLNRTLKVCTYKCNILEIFVGQAFGLVQHFGKLAVPTLRGFVCDGLDKQHIVAKLYKYACKKRDYKRQRNRPYYPFSFAYRFLFLLFLFHLASPVFLFVRGYLRRSFLKRKFLTRKV